MKRFTDKLESKLAGKTLPCHSGIVVNSYYSGVAAFCDVALQNESGQLTLLPKTPVVKIGGLSTSLPPVGSTALITYIDNNDQKPCVIGILDSEITEKFVEDTKRPRKPPTNLTR